MKIKKVTKNEFNVLMELMNVSFDMHGEREFENLLPKLYFKDNDKMFHYGAYEDDKLVASIGLYEMEMVSNYGSLKVGCIGAVSTHPDYRKKGYFTILMKKIVSYAKKKAYDLLFLGGNRYRYGHFGFENAGRKLVVCLSSRTKKELKPKEYSISLLTKDNQKDIIECLKLYNKQPQRMVRTVDNFYNHLISWNCKPYVVKVNNKIIGYYCLVDDVNIYEFVYKKGYKDTLLDSCLLDKKEVYVATSMKEYNEDTLRKVDWFRVEHNEMHLVFNWDNVAKYLNFKEGYQKEFLKLTSKEKIRVGLGNDAFESKYGESLFIFTCDQG